MKIGSNQLPSKSDKLYYLHVTGIFAQIKRRKIYKRNGMKKILEKKVEYSEKRNI